MLGKWRRGEFSCETEHCVSLQKLMGFAHGKKKTWWGVLMFGVSGDLVAARSLGGVCCYLKWEQCIIMNLSAK